jgi:hypothetical protein
MSAVSDRFFLGSSKLRRETVLALANLRDDSHEIFWKQFQGDYEKLGALSFPSARLASYEYRDSLRKIWEGDRQAMANIVSAWVQEANKRNPWSTQVLTNTRGQSVFVVPRHGILPLSLALGVSELWPKMAVCGNPECPNRYFLRGRKTQRFCDRPACAAYGQREHKRNWWNEHGAEWKHERSRESESRRKKRSKEAGRTGG